MTLGRPACLTAHKSSSTAPLDEKTAFKILIPSLAFAGETHDRGDGLEPRHRLGLRGIDPLYGLYKLGRDPVMGSSVILTAITDSMGFFIFLGLGTLFLV
jgi:hypothetical protein